MNKPPVFAGSFYPADAEELTNDVFIKIFNNRTNLCEEKNVKY